MNPIEIIKSGFEKIKGYVEDPFWSVVLSPVSNLLEDLADEAKTPEAINMRNLAILALKAYEPNLKALAANTETAIDDELVDEIIEACNNLISEYGLTPLPT